MTPIGEAVSLAVGISTVVSIIITKLWDAYQMEKKFVSKEQCEKCEDELKLRQVDRAEYRGIVKKKLEKMDDRLKLGNLIMSDLCEKAGIPISKIETYERSLGIKLRDNG